MIAIRAEIEAVETGAADVADNPLKHAPHTTDMVSANDWPHAYSREQAAFPSTSGSGTTNTGPPSAASTTSGAIATSSAVVPEWKGLGLEE